MNIKELEIKATEVRCGIIKALHAAGSGHPGGSLSSADIVTALYFDEMNVDPEEPKMAGRDKLVFSKGHAGPCQYAALAVRGYYPEEELLTLRKIGSKFQGHPNMQYVPGIEMSTGSLGQGFGAAGGMALANKLDDDPGRVYVLLGDGELQEGLVWEAAMSAAHYKLDNLVGIVDHNGLQIDGRNDDVMTVMPIAEKFEAFGWNVICIDGHDMQQILDAFAKARQTKGRPTMIVAETIKGKGVSFMEDQAGWHGKAPNDEQAQQALAELEALLASQKAEADQPLEEQ
ncbi:MAG: transketolase [Firmicutes bacterium]|nr:transketolase [Bacillota bacterium]